LGIATARAGDDGSYRFDTLAADTYTVTARSGTIGRGSSRSAAVAVSSGTEAHLDLDVPVGSVTVSVTVAGPAGVEVHGAEVILLSGAVQAPTAAALADTVAARGEGSSHSGFSFNGRPATLTSVVPGAYSACAVPLPPNVTNPRDFAGLRGQLAKLVCACAPVTIAEAPETQAVTVPVPAPPNL